MSSYEDFTNAINRLAFAGGDLAGGLAANEFVVKPAREKARKEQQLQQAIYLNNAPLALQLAKELGLAGDNWDYETEQRDTKVPTTPIKMGPMSAATTPAQSMGFFQQAQANQSLSNPLGLSGTAQSLSASFQPGKDLVETKPDQYLPPAPLRVMPTLDNPMGIATAKIPAEFSYADKLKPMTMAGLTQAAQGNSQLAQAPTSPYNFAVMREAFRTDTLANTPENRQRLMSLYAGKMPEPIAKETADNALRLITPGVGFTPTRSEMLVKPSVSLDTQAKIAQGQREADLKIKLAQYREDQAMARAIMAAATQRRGQDLSYEVAQLKLRQDGPPDVAGLNKDEAKEFFRIQSAADKVRSNFLSSTFGGPDALRLLGEPEQLRKVYMLADQLALNEAAAMGAGINNPRLGQALSRYFQRSARRSAEPPESVTIPSTPGQPVATPTPAQAPPAPTAMPTIAPTPTPTTMPTQRPLPAASRPPAIPAKPRPPEAAGASQGLNPSTAKAIPPSLRTQPANAAAAKPAAKPGLPAQANGKDNPNSRAKDFLKKFKPQ